MSNSQSELRIATLTPEEDARWVELFTSKVEAGWPTMSPTPRDGRGCRVSSLA
jgi:hypothetical protein